MTFAREAWPFVLPFALLSAGLFVTRHPAWGAGAALVAVALLLFFRDPTRRAEGGPELLVAPADGKVTAVDEIEDPAIGDGRLKRVVTFLSVFDVHIQRVPATGTVVSSHPRAGRKVAAFRDDAGEINAGQLTVIERADGSRYGIRQIVGLLARRVVCYLKPGQRVSRGERLGLIKFGSRVDLLVPEDWEILVAPGDRMRNGETPIARAALAEP